MVCRLGVQPMMSEVPIFGYSLCISYAGMLLSLVIGGVVLLGFRAIGPRRGRRLGRCDSDPARPDQGKVPGAQGNAKTPYAQGEADALAGRPCLYEHPLLAGTYSERLYYSGYHDTLDRIRREAQEAERLL
jgi:hypothetical protein